MLVTSLPFFFIIQDMGVDLTSGYHFFILPPIGPQVEFSILARLEYYCYLINLIS